MRLPGFRCWLEFIHAAIDSGPIGIRPAPEMCGDSAEQAMATLVQWETLTAPRAKGDR